MGSLPNYFCIQTPHGYEPIFDLNLGVNINILEFVEIVSKPKPFNLIAINF